MLQQENVIRYTRMKQSHDPTVHALSKVLSLPCILNEILYYQIGLEQKRKEKKKEKKKEEKTRHKIKEKRRQTKGESVFFKTIFWRLKYDIKAFA